MHSVQLNIQSSRFGEGVKMTVFEILLFKEVAFQKYPTNFE